MFNKLISLVLLSTAFVTMGAANQHGNSPFYLVLSSNRWSGLARLTLMLIITVLSFKLLNLKGRFSAIIIGLLGLSLIVGGAVTLCITSLSSLVYDYIKPLDTIMFMEAGVVLLLAALSVKFPVTYHVSQPRSAKLIKKQQLSQAA